MASMAADVVTAMGKTVSAGAGCLFCRGTGVCDPEKAVVDSNGQRLVHVVTRAKSNVVGYEDPPAWTGGRGRPRIYGPKLKLMDLFEAERKRLSKPPLKCMAAVKPFPFCAWI
jgi:hypothetical protein